MVRQLLIYWSNTVFRIIVWINWRCYLDYPKNFFWCGWILYCCFSISSTTVWHGHITVGVVNQLIVVWVLAGVKHANWLGGPLSIYICVCNYVYMDVCIYVLCVCAYMCVCVCVCMYVCVCNYVCMDVCIFVCVNMCACMHVYVCVCVCVCFCMYVCM